MTRKPFAVAPWGYGIFVGLMLLGCSKPGEPSSQPAPQEEEVVMPEFAFDVTNSAFSDGSPIPARYTCDGDDISPPLEWSVPPEGTRSIALIADDPDAPRGTWVHWVLYAIPPGLTGLTEKAPGQDVLPSGARHGKNSSNRREYGGPCPPGGTHRYFFKLYALDAEIDLKPGATKDELLKAMEGRILASGELMGTYQRR